MENSQLRKLHKGAKKILSVRLGKEEAKKKRVRKLIDIVRAGLINPPRNIGLVGDLLRCPDCDGRIEYEFVEIGNDFFGLSIYQCYKYYICSDKKGCGYEYVERQNPPQPPASPAPTVPKR